jgi:CubicO group peptidase (beta-lactamase class C family)
MALAAKAAADATHDISEILRISGTPSLSYAVIHHGSVVHTQHFGYRDVESKTSPNNNTRHNINSLTKALVASLAAMEVAKGTLSWSNKVKDYLPGFSSGNSLVQEECTIIDLLSHRTGLSSRDLIWSGPDNQLLLDRSQALPTFATLKTVGDFRASFTYNNWGYELVGQILEQITGKQLSRLLRERIFDPLKMTHTSTEWDHPSGNNANSYTVLDDLTSYQVPRPMMEKGQLMEAAGGVKSTIGDMILLYQEMLEALAPGFQSSKRRADNVFKDCLDIFQHHNLLPGFSMREQTYGAGWCRAQVPGQLGRISENAGLGPQPVVGTNASSRLVIYHHGSMCGSTTVVNLLPETRTAVIALQNSLGPVDAADFAAELLIERLLNVPKRVDYVQLTQEHTHKAFRYMNKIKGQLDRERTPGTSHRPLSAYVGTYWNSIHNWRIDVSLAEEDKLVMVLQGVKSQPFSLQHYQNDTFSWWMSYNDIMRAARFAIGTQPHYWLIHFGVDDDGKIDKIMWALEASLPDYREAFTRDPESIPRCTKVTGHELTHLCNH